MECNNKITKEQIEEISKEIDKAKDEGRTFIQRIESKFIISTDNHYLETDINLFNDFINSLKQ
jgi:murein L,D-transpeptidase YafK